MACLLFLVGRRAIADVTVQTTGLVTVNADTNAATGTGTYTAVTTNPIISEGNTGDLAASWTITITPPDHFDFDASQTVSAIITGGDPTFDLGAGPGNTAIAGQTSGSSRQATMIQFTVAAASTVNPVSITFTGLHLRPLNCTGADTSSNPTAKITTSTLADGDLITVTVTPGVLSRFLVNGQNSPQLAGNPITVEITALDACDNPVPNFDPSADIQFDSSDNAVEYGNPSGGFTLTDNADGTATLESDGINTFDGNGRFSFDVTRDAAVVATLTANGENSATGSTVVQWTAGTLANFFVEAMNLPQDAGNDILIRVTARDAANNPIANFDPTLDIEISSGGNTNVTYGNPSGGFALNDHGDGTATIVAAGTNTFDGNGRLTFMATNLVAETVTITLTGENAAAGNADATWNAGGLDDFLVDSAPPQQAGQEVQITLTARDANDNPIANFDPTINIQVSSNVATVRFSNVSGGFTLVDFGDGTARIDASGSQTFDPNGQLTFDVVNETAGTATITASGENNATGNADATWTAGGLDRFLVESGAAQPAGQPIQITITAMDEFDNPISNFAPAADIDVVTDNANVTYPNPPAGLLPDAAANGNATIATGTGFDANGQFNFNVSDSQVESVPMTVSDGTASGLATVSWTAGNLVDFLVEALNSPQPTANGINVRVTARDVDGNPIANFDPASDLQITTTTTDLVNAGSNISYSKASGGFTLTDHGDGTATVSASGVYRFDGNGQLSFVVSNTFPEVSTITVDGENAATGNTDATWNLGPVSEFLVEALNSPQQAGGVVNVRLTARDAGGNALPGFEPATDIAISATTGGDGANLAYSNPSGGFSLNDNGDGTATLVAAAGTSFDPNGQFTFDVINTLAEISTLSAAGENNAIGSTNVEWTLGPFATFFVEALNSPKAAGSPIKIRIIAQDALNNPIPNFDPVSDILLDGGGGSVVFSNPYPTTFTLDGVGTATIGAGGVAQFDGSGALTFDVTNTVAETSIITVDDGTVTGTTAATWVAGPADHLAFVVQPVDTPAGQPLLPVVAIQDQFGNTVTNDDRVISLALGNDASGGTATLGSAYALSVTSAGGLATWTDGRGLNLDVAAVGYTLVASHLGPTFRTADTAESAAFDIMVAQPPAGQSVLQQPAGSEGTVSMTSGELSVTVRGLEVGVMVTLQPDAAGRTVVIVGDEAAPTLVVDVDDGVSQVDVTIKANGDQTIIITRDDGSRAMLQLMGLPDGATVRVTTNADGSISLGFTDASGEAIGATVLIPPMSGDAAIAMAYHATPPGGGGARIIPGFPGLVGGESYGGSVTVSAVGIEPDSSITVSLSYSDADVRGNRLPEGFGEAGLKLVRLNESTGVFEPAGTNHVGVAAPTGILGDYGVDTDNNVAWAVVDTLGTFAVGVPESDVSPQCRWTFDPLVSLLLRFPVCGISCALAICGTFAGLLGMRFGRKRRRSGGGGGTVSRG